MPRPLIVALAAACIALSGCGTFTPQTAINAGRVKLNAMPLALAVQDCVAGTPAEREIAPHFNDLLDTALKYRDVDFDEGVAATVAGAADDLAAGRADWIAIKASLARHGLDCGDYVRAEAANVEAVFDDLQGAIAANERVRYALTVLRMFGVVRGEPVRVERMAVPG